MFFLAVHLSYAGQVIEVYFSPNGGCQQAVISEIKKADSNDRYCHVLS